MRITNLDPLPYNLIFERFLNIERVSLPDIDVDFCEDKRTRVIQYVSQKYGIDSVSQITTFGKMKAKAVVRDVGRALDMSFKETDRIAALITELRKLGYLVRSEQDSILLWDGERCPAENTPIISTYEDHRMAMAFAPVGLKLPGLVIRNAGVVTKSFPTFWEQLDKLLI